MNTILPNNPYLAPHLMSRRISPSRSQTPPNNLMSGKKRKASSDDDGSNDGDTMMTRSPSASPSIPAGILPSNHSRTIKRARKNASGQPLNLPRLLETLSPDELRNLLRGVVDRNPQLHQEITNMAPRPSAESVLSVLSQYEHRMRASVPFGNRMTSDYAFNRVRGPLIELLDALKDYTQNFLPPRETQTSVSLKFLDEVTNMVHRLPNWDSYQNQRHKHEAYEELSTAWALVIREAAKRAGGFQLRVGQWDEKLGKHDQTSGGRLGEAMEALRESLSWMGGNQEEPSASNAGPSNLQAGMGGTGPGGSGRNTGVPSIREQLFSGTYGMGSGGRMGGWE